MYASRRFFARSYFAGVWPGIALPIGRLLAAEARDSAAFVGEVIGFPTVLGTLAALEARDSASLAAFARHLAVLAATEAKDSAAIAAFARHLATLAATERKDSAALSGLLAAFGTLVGHERADAAQIIGFLEASGILAALESEDIAAFLGRARTIEYRHIAEFLAHKGVPALIGRRSIDLDNLARVQLLAALGRRNSIANFDGAHHAAALIAREQATAFVGSVQAMLGIVGRM